MRSSKLFNIILCCNLLLLSGCLVPPKLRNTDNASVFNWQNDYVTFDQFTKDSIPMQSQFMKMLDPLSPRVMPKWDGFWATFENRRYADTSQRIAVQFPPGTSHWTSGRYKKCMYKKGYYLVY